MRMLGEYPGSTHHEDETHPKRSTKVEEECIIINYIIDNPYVLECYKLFVRPTTARDDTMICFESFVAEWTYWLGMA